MERVPDRSSLCNGHPLWSSAFNRVSRFTGSGGRDRTCITANAVIGPRRYYLIRRNNSSSIRRWGCCYLRSLSPSIDRPRTGWLGGLLRRRRFLRGCCGCCGCCCCCGLFAFTTVSRRWRILILTCAAKTTRKELRRPLNRCIYGRSQRSASRSQSDERVSSRLILPILGCRRP